MDFLNSLVSEFGPAAGTALTLTALAMWKASVFLFSPRKAVKEDTAPSYASVAFWACVWAASWLAMPVVIPCRLMAGRNVWGDLPPVPEKAPLGEDALALIEDIETSPVAQVVEGSEKGREWLSFGKIAVMVTGLPAIHEDGKPVDGDYTGDEQAAIRTAAEARAKAIKEAERASRRSARVGVKRTPAKASCDCGAGCKGGCDCGCDPKAKR